jgi:biopolymer transport protein ExbB
MAWLTKSRSGLLLSQLVMAGVLWSLASVSLAWWQGDWAYRKQIVIDGSATGAALSGDVSNVPVLVRLHEGVFHFTDAKPDGSDIRFVTDDDKTPLKFHIDKFDSVFNMAQIWVQLPKLTAKEPVKIWMYYGNTKAAAAADPSSATYDGNQLLVYHFGERGTPVADSTSDALNATTPSAVVDSGLIGASAKFDGTSAVLLPASPQLALNASGELTLSTWIKPLAADPAMIVYAQRDASGAAFVVGLTAGAPYVAVADAGGALLSSPPTTPIADSNWHRLSVVAGKGQIQVFVDGQVRTVLSRALPTVSGAASLGGDGAAGRPVAQGFRGELDEFSLAREARSPAWLALEAGNQGAADKLVKFGADEQQSSFSSGYVGIILGSVTLDGWVVIGTLIVMMLISWVIMAGKGRQVGRAARANQAFLNAYDQVNGDFALLHVATKTPEKSALKLDSDVLTLLQDSPLMHMFHVGIDELHGRLAGNARRGPVTVLSEQSIEAIRAKLNARLLRETQTLNKRMVLLTIAISGGPFIGLLGTVVGVMITFAAVAAAGDVNVNAIAPGIAAALAATVAGLFVAIPALFGYNYLISRVKECSMEMHVFIEAFVTRMAESYDDSNDLHQLSD